MSDPKIRNLEEEFSLNKSVGPNKVDFLFHCNQENIDHAIISPINPLYKDQLALIQTGGKKMRGKNLNENPSSGCIFSCISTNKKDIYKEFMIRNVGGSA